MTPDLLEVGRIVKVHGLRGEVLVELYSDFPDRLNPGSVLTRSDGGDLTIETSRLHQGRWLIFFEGVRGREAAEALGRPTLLAERREIEGALWVDELIGCLVELADGTHVGTVAAVEANPASDLLVLDSGALVPLTFVLEHVPSIKVVIDPPEGLLELASDGGS